MEIMVNSLIPMFLIMLTGFLCIHFKILPQETPHFFIKKCYPQKPTGFAALIAYAVSLGNSAFIGPLILVLVAGSKGTILAVVSSVIVILIFMPSVIYFIKKSINKNTEKVKYGVLKDVLKIFKNPIVLSGF